MNKLFWPGKYLAALSLVLGAFNLHPQGFMGQFNNTSYIDLGYNITNFRVRSITFNFTPDNTINGTANDGYTFIGRNDSTENKEYGVFIRGTDWVNVGGMGTLCFYYRNNHALHEIQSNQSTWLANTCYHVAATLDSIQGMKLYINGVLQNQNDPAGVGPVLKDTNYITTIGCWGDYYLRHFIGTINNMAIWNTALNAVQIQSVMNGSIIPNNSQLIALYNFDEGSGITLIDGTVNGLNGIVYGSGWVKERECSFATGIENNEQSGEILIYPNPSGGKIKIQNLSSEFNVYNFIGQKITIAASSSELDFSSQPSGVYFIHSGQRLIKYIKD